MSRGYLCLAALACAAAILPVPVAAQNSGSVHSSEWNGTTWVVNANSISDPSAVFLSGGPQNGSANGFPLGTSYYFQVTDPSGKTLLSEDDIACRIVQVEPGIGGAGVLFPAPAGANCTTSPHPDALALGLPLDPNGGDPVRLAPFAPSPNGGGIYKLWIVPVGQYQACSLQNGTRSGGVTDTVGCQGSFGFVASNTKTDNFKVTCSTTSLQMGSATVASGGSGYNLGDTGVFVQGTANNASYTVTGVSGGAVTAFVLTFNGTGYSTGMATTMATKGS